MSGSLNAKEVLLHKVVSCVACGRRRAGIEAVYNSDEVTKVAEDRTRRMLQ